MQSCGRVLQVENTCDGIEGATIEVPVDGIVVASFDWVGGIIEQGISGVALAWADGLVPSKLLDGKLQSLGAACSIVREAWPLVMHKPQLYTFERVARQLTISRCLRIARQTLLVAMAAFSYICRSFSIEYQAICSMKNLSQPSLLEHSSSRLASTMSCICCATTAPIVFWISICPDIFLRQILVFSGAVSMQITMSQTN